MPAEPNISGDELVVLDDPYNIGGYVVRNYRDIKKDSLNYIETEIKTGVVVLAHNFRSARARISLNRKIARFVTQHDMLESVKEFNGWVLSGFYIPSKEVARNIAEKSSAPETQQLMQQCINGDISGMVFRNAAFALPEFQDREGINKLFEILTSSISPTDGNNILSHALPLNFRWSITHAGLKQNSAHHNQNTLVGERFMQAFFIDQEMTRLDDMQRVVEKRVESTYRKMPGYEKYDYTKDPEFEKVFTPPLTDKQARRIFKSLIANIKALPDALPEARDFILSNLKPPLDVIIIKNHRSMVGHHMNHHAEPSVALGFADKNLIYTGVKSRRYDQAAIGTILEEGGHHAMMMYDNLYLPYTSEEDDPRIRHLKKAIELDLNSKQQIKDLTLDTYKPEKFHEEAPVKILRNLAQGIDTSHFPHLTQFVKEVTLPDWQYYKKHGIIPKEPQLKDFTVQPYSPDTTPEQPEVSRRNFLYSAERAGAYIFGLSTVYSFMEQVVYPTIFHESPLNLFPPLNPDTNIPPNTNNTAAPTPQPLPVNPTNHSTEPVSPPLPNGNATSPATTTKKTTGLSDVSAEPITRQQAEPSMPSRRVLLKAIVPSKPYR